MQALFPGLNRPKEEPFPEYKEYETPELPNTTSCTACGINRDDWMFDDLSVCVGCGTIMERPIDSGAEYRFFGLEDRCGSDPCRVGAPIDPRFPGSSLGTIILNHAQGGSASARMTMARVRRYHTWNLLPYKERSLLQVFEQIAITATNNGFDVRTMDMAKDMYVKLVEHCDRRGMSRTSVVASCIYSSLKQGGQPRKPKDIATMFHLSTAQFTKSLKYFQEILCMANQRGLLRGAAPAAQPSTCASNYIAHPLSQLPIPRATTASIKQQCIAIATEIERKELCPENMPPSIAAGIIAYALSANHPEILHTSIATACGVSEGTLQKCLKKIESAVNDGLIKGVA
jgi:transcription initiation factor TFIIIB Brf1 subunit/transcription initiation factor TFIIB